MITTPNYQCPVCGQNRNSKYHRNRCKGIPPRGDKEAGRKAFDDANEARLKANGYR